MIVGPDGNVLAGPLTGEPGIIYADADRASQSQSSPVRPRRPLRPRRHPQADREQGATARRFVLRPSTRRRKTPASRIGHRMIHRVAAPTRWRRSRTRRDNGSRRHPTSRYGRACRQNGRAECHKQNVPPVVLVVAVHDLWPLGCRDHRWVHDGPAEVPLKRNGPPEASNEFLTYRPV